MRTAQRQATTRPPARKRVQTSLPASCARRTRGAGSADILGRPPKASATSGRIPKRWRWHYRVLWSLRERLAQERGALRHAATEPIEPHSLDEADSATDEFDHDFALRELSAAQDAFSEVNEALARIQNGCYGICEESGEAIPAPRLRAIPWTRFLRAVEERLEKKGMVRRPRMGDRGTVRQGGRTWLAPEEEAEETAEAPAAPPRDEALSRVFSPPGRHLSRRGQSRRSSKAKRKGKL